MKQSIFVTTLIVEFGKGNLEKITNPTLSAFGALLCASHAKRRASGKAVNQKTRADKGALNFLERAVVASVGGRTSPLALDFLLTF